MKSSLFLALVPAAVLAYSDIKEASLKVHNQYRAEHAAPALKWSEEAAATAQAHADKCHYGHSSNSKYGENIAAGYETAEKAVSAWGDERDKYDFGSQGFSSECGHFTQMVWKNTASIGCGAALCDGLIGSGKQWFYVCNYDEAGNVEGQYEDNVSPKTKGYKQKPAKEDNYKPEDKSGKPKKKPSKEPKYAVEEPSYEVEDPEEEDDSYPADNDSDDEYDSEDDEDDYSSKKWKPAHKKWNSRNRWNPYKHNKYHKYNKWNSKKYSPKKYSPKNKWGQPKKHYGKNYHSGKNYDSGKYDSSKWGYNSYDSY